MLNEYEVTLPNGFVTRMLLSEQRAEKLGERAKRVQREDVVTKPVEPEDEAPKPRRGRPPKTK